MYSPAEGVWWGSVPRSRGSPAAEERTTLLPTGPTSPGGGKERHLCAVTYAVWGWGLPTSGGTQKWAGGRDAHRLRVCDLSSTAQLLLFTVH